MASILLVEDDEMIARMISLRLEIAGHQMHIATNGQEGIERIESGDFELVLMDMHMPVMDGHQAVRQLRDKGYAGTIIAVTASAMSSDSRKAIDSGCDGFIAKPIGDDFESQVAGFLNHSGSSPK